MILQIKDLSFKYQDINVLENINLTVQKDDFLAIIGPNGGGKSTLLKLILNLLKPTKGQIILNNKILNQTDLGYVPQNTNLNLDFPITALEVVLMGHFEKNPHNHKENWLKKYFNIGYSDYEILCAKHSLKQVGMEDFADYKIGDLSGGQRQRIFIARSLSSHPKVLLLDEPTASIDVQGQREIYDLLKELNKTITIIVVSHDISVLLNYASKVAHINKNIVYHTLDNVDYKMDNNQHICEVELLHSLGKSNRCGCDHD